MPASVKEAGGTWPSPASGDDNAVNPACVYRQRDPGPISADLDIDVNSDGVSDVAVDCGMRRDLYLMLPDGCIRELGISFRGRFVPVDGPKPDGAGRLVTGRVGGGERQCGIVPPTGALADRAVADGVFQAPGRAGDVRRAVGIEANVAQVSGPADVAFEQPAVHHRGAAHAGAEGQQDDVARAGGGALPHLAHQRRLRVVQHGHPRRAGEERGPVQPLHLPEPALHPEDAAAVGGGDAGSGDAD